MQKTKNAASAPTHKPMHDALLAYGAKLEATPDFGRLRMPIRGVQAYASQVDKLPFGKKANRSIADECVSSSRNDDAWRGGSMRTLERNLAGDIDLDRYKRAMEGFQRG